MDTRKPVRTEGIVSRQLGDELLLYDSDKSVVHITNETAETIWQLCDGSHTISDMENHVREAFDAPDGTDVKADITAIIKEFHGLGIIDCGEEPSPTS